MLFNLAVHVAVPLHKVAILIVVLLLAQHAKAENANARARREDAW